MKIQTFSVVAGSMACNARCPFCVSKMTPPNGVALKEPEFDFNRFNVAASLAIKGGCTTAMITSKGEPTLFPKQVTEITERLGNFQAESGELLFPIIEMQTNGIPIADQRRDKAQKYLAELAGYGMTTIAISVVHHNAEKNRGIYLPYRKEYIDLPGLIATIHSIRPRLSVRLAVVMVNGFIDSVEAFEEMLTFARVNNIEQLSFRPVNKPDTSENDDVAIWTAKHFLPPEKLQAIEQYVRTTGNAVGRLGHGATIYDVGGQNVCLTNSLTLNADSEELRQLIYFPDGAIRWDWRYSGARML